MQRLTKTGQSTVHHIQRRREDEINNTIILQHEAYVIYINKHCFQIPVDGDFLDNRRLKKMFPGVLSLYFYSLRNIPSALLNFSHLELRQETKRGPTQYAVLNKVAVQCQC